MEIKPEHLFDVPFWINPCLINFLTKRLELQVKILKNTSLKGEEIENWVEKNIDKWNVSKRLISRYINEIGENAYSLLNILTDSASNFEDDNSFDDYKKIQEDYLYDYPVLKNMSRENQGSKSERATRQRRVGLFLESLVAEIIKENQIEPPVIDINSDDFKINDECMNMLDALKTKKVYKLDIGKVKF